jgi:phosphonate transport system substrate-binding protein
MSKRVNVSYKKDLNQITYAYLPQYAHRTSYERHHLIIEYLNQETGLNIEQIFPDTFDEHMDMVKQGKIDISYVNPFAYIKIAEHSQAQAFARIIENDGRKEFRSQIICLTNNKQIQSLNDCKGKRWMAVDHSSAAGYLFALGHFLENGINQKDFAEIAFSPGPAGKQEKVVLAVYTGQYDIGSVREGTLEVVAGKIDTKAIRVVANSRWYPGWLYAARPGLDPEVLEKIKKALFKLDWNNVEHKKILRAADFRGIVPSGDSEFNPIRRLAQLLDSPIDN